MYNPNDIVLNRFKIIERISFGAFSLVYKAFDETKQQELCIKIEKIDEEEGESMIYHEYFVAQSFNSPFLCHSYDYFEDGPKNLKLYSEQTLDAWYRYFSTGQVEYFEKLIASFNEEIQ